MVNRRINAAVEASGLDKNDIARQIGMSETALNSLLAGDRAVQADEFYGLCKVLDLSPDELYHYDDRSSAG